MPSVWSSLPTLTKNVEVKLFPRESRRGRSRSLRIEADTGIKASFTSKGDNNYLDESDDAYDSDDEISFVPFSVAGVDGTAKKPIRLRFNPEVLKSAESDEAVQEALKKTTFMVLEEHLAGEYVLDPTDRIDPKLQLLSQLESIFTGRAPALEISAENQLALVWPVNPLDLISPAEAKKQLSSPARRMTFLEQFFVKVSDYLSVTVVPGRGTPKPDYNILGALLKPTITPTSQIVEIIVNKKGLHKKLLSIELMAFPRLDDSSTHSFHRIEFSEREETIRLELVPRNSRSRRTSWVAPDAFVAIGSLRFLKSSTDQNWMIDCAHLRVQELRPELSTTLGSYPKVMTTRDLSDIDPDKTISAASSASHPPVDVVYISTSAVMVQVDPLTPRRSSISSRFKVSPIPNALPPRRCSESSVPLHVEASLTVTGTNAVSPSESIDSGVASPGAMSDAERARIRASEERVVRGLKLRDRSASECFPQQYTVPHTPGLKGILKKPKWSFGSAPTEQGSMRRSPASSRLLYARSVSECVDGNDFDDDLNNLSMSESSDTIESGSPPQTDSLMFRVDEEDENSESGLNTADDSDSADVTTPPATVMRKKRVSFSEKVQARIYRSNSSVANRDKRKKQQRIRRGSESGDESGSLTESIVEDAFSMTPAEQAILGDIAKEISSTVTYSPESVKRAVRITSTDSAIGDEEDDVCYEEDVEVCLETLRVA